MENVDLFSCVMPGGIVYCDRSREVSGDYMRLAFIPFRALEIRWDHPRHRLPADIVTEIEADAADLQSHRGELYTTSTCGQTIRLGG